MSTVSLRKAESDGYDAGRDGLPASVCPYRDIRKLDGRLTFSRAYLNAWNQGWRRGKQEHTKLAAEAAKEDEKGGEGEIELPGGGGKG